MNIKGSWNILSEKLALWAETAIGHLPNFVLAAVVLIGFAISGRVVKNLLGRILLKTSDNIAVNNLLGAVVYFVVLIAGLFTALGILQLDKTVTSLLAGAGVIGIALGFAFQEIAANFISGIFIAFRKPYRIGDIIKISEFQGQVSEINIRTTHVTTFQGLEVILPNKDMFTKPLINYTSTPERRVDINVGISYGDDLRKVEQVTREAVEKISGRIMDKPIEFFFENLATVQ